MTEEDALTRLDEIERLAPDPTTDAGAHAVMSELAQTPGGLRLLVERYAGSPSTNIAGYLAIVLAENSGKGRADAAPLIFEFASRLRRRDYEGALVSTLSAIQRELAFGRGWGDSPRPPAALFDFIQHCLNYSGPHHSMVQSGAVGVLTDVCLSDLLGRAFEPEQLEWIKDKVQQLSETADDMLGDSIAEFMRCVEGVLPHS